MTPKLTLIIELSRRNGKIVEHTVCSLDLNCFRSLGIGFAKSLAVRRGNYNY